VQNNILLKYLEDKAVTADEAQGVLAIWNDIRDGRESDFEFWYKNEHFPERLGVPGFRLGRRYEAVSGVPRYFCYYLTDTPDTLTSAAYIERLNNPTPLTRSMMTDVFLNMSRTMCRRVKRFGAMSGALCVTVRFHQAADQAPTLSMLDKIARADGVACCELWSSADSGKSVSKEEQLRGGDRKIAACMIVETLRLADAENMSDRFNSEFGAVADIGIYRLLCELTPPRV
jgi:hypothetical protein